MENAINDFRPIARTTIKHKRTVIKILLSCLLAIFLAIPISLVSFIVTPPFTALALRCDSPSCGEGGGGEGGGGESATPLDLPGPGESTPVTIDGEPGGELSGPRTFPSGNADDDPERRAAKTQCIRSCLSQSPQRRGACIEACSEN